MTNLCIVTGRRKQPTLGRGFAFTPKYDGPQGTDPQEFVVLFCADGKSHLEWTAKETRQQYMTLAEAQEEAQEWANNTSVVGAVMIVNVRNCQTTTVEGGQDIADVAAPSTWNRSTSSHSMPTRLFDDEKLPDHYEDDRIFHHPV